MIKFTATGTVYSISPVLTFGDKGYQKRELIIDDSYTRGGETFSNFMAVDFTGERMAMLDNFKPGQIVTVEACINGRWKNTDTGEAKLWHSIKGLNINPYVSQSQQPTQNGGYVNPANGARYNPYQETTRQPYQQPAPYGPQPYQTQNNGYHH